MWFGKSAEGIGDDDDDDDKERAATTATKKTVESSGIFQSLLSYTFCASAREKNNGKEKLISEYSPSFSS